MTAGKRDLEALIEEITVDCDGEDEELTGFLTYLEDALERPVEATVVGVPVTIVGVDCPAGALRGLVARCRRDGGEYEVSLLDVAHLQRVDAAYWERDWRRKHKGLGIYPEDHLWRATHGYLDLLAATRAAGAA